MEPITVSAIDGSLPVPNGEKRLARWHSFNVIFTLGYLGIALDILTTRIGFGIAGSAYEQNPIGAFLIGHIGWWGMALILTGASLVFYKACRVVFFHSSPAWSVILNSALAIVTAVRWLAVATAIIFITH